MTNKKKRKGGGNGDDCEVQFPRLENSVESIKKPHFSLEDCLRLKKKCKENVNVEELTDGLCCIDRNSILGVATTPPCGEGLLSSVEPSSSSSSRGLKRKIGCIGVATQMGRKNKLEDDYVKVKTIGQGKFGSVWLCKDKVSGEALACKTLRKGEETVHREVEIMQHLSGHPGIVMLKAVYEDSECFHLVMELCSGGRLIDRMIKEGRYSERGAACLMKELMMVIRYCHGMGVVHRDIKPENILLTSSGKMKLADFGLAMRIADGQSLTGLAGSRAYIAPEVISGTYCEKVDIWSAGVLLHALLTGSLPFQGNSLETVFDKIKNDKLDFHSGMWLSVSKPARNLIEKMLTRDVSARIAAEQVLGHPWIVFYTEQTLKLPVTPKLKTQLNATYEVIGSSQWKLDGSTVKIALPSEGSSSSASSSKCRVTSDSAQRDDYELLDALTVAISQVTISEPKRSRLCGSLCSMQQQHSASSLCKAY
ncbi:hypothetical protein Ancab_036481 [Ancistrocladus abbreviatus]